MVARDYWTCPPLWRGQSCVITGCGPSLAITAVDRLRGHNVIAVKESWWWVPWAAFMVYCDDSWTPNLDVTPQPPPDAVGRPPDFAGEIVTTAAGAKAPCRVMRSAGPHGITDDPTALAGRRTSVRHAMNLARHLGVRRIGLVGVDQSRGDDGRTHCHKGHTVRSNSFARSMAELATSVEPLRTAGIEVFNCTVGGALELWPRMPLAQFLAES